jgi:hypothetical protein
MNIESLNKVKEYLSEEIFRYCLLVNIDPETFDYLNFIDEHKNNLLSMTKKYYPELVIQSEKLKIVEQKIQQLNLK